MTGLNVLNDNILVFSWDINIMKKLNLEKAIDCLEPKRTVAYLEIPTLEQNRTAVENLAVLKYHKDWYRVSEEDIISFCFRKYKPIRMIQKHLFKAYGIETENLEEAKVIVLSMIAFSIEGCCQNEWRRKVIDKIKAKNRS